MLERVWRKGRFGGADCYVDDSKCACDFDESLVEEGQAG